MAFEKKVHRALDQALRAGWVAGASPEDLLYSHQWIKYEDLNGPGFAQPDHFILTDHGILLMEDKRTQCTAGWDQMDELYLPLLQHMWPGHAISRILICQNLKWEPELLVDGPDELADGATWHYLP